MYGYLGRNQLKMLKIRKFIQCNDSSFMFHSFHLQSMGSIAIHGSTTSQILEPYFMDPEPCLDPAMEGIEIDPLSIDPEEYKTEEEKKKEFEEIQRLAIEKQKKRIEVMGVLLRSKGFFWNAPTNVSFYFIIIL